MTDLDNMQANVDEAKAEAKKTKKEFGKRSVEYAEAKQVVRDLKDALEFAALHA